jgi:hypothetical protein
VRNEAATKEKLMIGLTENQMNIVQYLGTIASSNNGVLDDMAVESCDDDVIELFFRKKILVRIPGKSNGPQCYRLDVTDILSHNPEELKIQEQEILMDIWLKLADNSSKLSIKRLRYEALKSLAQPAE